MNRERRRETAGRIGFQARRAGTEISLARGHLGLSLTHAAKRDELQVRHARPVRLVMAIEDTAHDRRLLGDHAALVQSTLPAGSRAVLRSIRTGTPLTLDGLLWVRRAG